jgi:hypothetical protein
MGWCRPGSLRGFTTAWSTSQAQTRSASARLPTTSWSWSPPPQQRRSTPATTRIAQRLTRWPIEYLPRPGRPGHTAASLNGGRRAGPDVSGLAPWRTPTLTVHSIRERRCHTFSSFQPCEGSGPNANLTHGSARAHGNAREGREGPANRWNRKSSTPADRALRHTAQRDFRASRPRG